MRNQKEVYEEFIVRGFGEFPIDMLRYDKCWPKTEEDSAKIINPPDGRYDVSLLGNSTPNTGRWKSFCFSVLY